MQTLPSIHEMSYHRQSILHAIMRDGRASRKGRRLRRRRLTLPNTNSTPFTATVDLPYARD
ncbi:MAG: hypothetical protein ACODAE_05265, partial [Gemmatimonadota bacterium]